MAQHALTPFRSGGLLGADPFLSLHREMNRLFDDALRGAGVPTSGRGDDMVLSPQINVSETDSEICITAEMPGVQEKDISIELNDDVLTIKGEKQLERKDEKENFYFIERSYGTFMRTLQLPSPVNPDQVQATFGNGVLTVTLPKNVQQQRSRRIRVSSEATSSTGKGSQGEAQTAQNPAETASKRKS